MAILDNLVAYWSLSDAQDAHGSNHLTAVNAPTFGAGKVGNAVYLERDALQRLTITDNAELRTGDVDFVFCAWFRLESAAAYNTIAAKRMEDNAEWYLLVRGGQLRARLYVYINGDSVRSEINTANSSVTLATWHFVAAWHDSTANTINIQLDNGTVYSTAHNAAEVGGPAPFTIGVFGASSEPFDGQIDEAGFWKGRVLTAEERTWLYNGGAGRDYAALVAEGGGGTTHELTATGVTTGAPSIWAGALAESEAFAATGLTTGAPVVTAIALGETEALSASDVVTGAVVVGAAALAGAETLGSTGVTTGQPITSSAALGETERLAPSNVVTGAPQIESAPISSSADADVLTAAGVTVGTPVVGHAIVAETERLAADAVTAGVPEVGAVSVAEVETLSATGIAAGAPQMANATIGYTFALDAVGIVTGAPTCEAAALWQARHMTAANLWTEQPLVGAPALAETEQLLAIDVATGAPIVPAVFFAVSGLPTPLQRTRFVVAEERSGAIAAESRMDVVAA